MAKTIAIEPLNLEQFPFRCEQCPAEFKSYEGLKIHDELVHSKPQVIEMAVPVPPETVLSNVRCSKCGFSVAPREKDVILDHGVRTVTCPSCRSTIWLDQPKTATEAALRQEPTKVTAHDICREAADLVGGPRQASHGDKSINFKNTADAWNALLSMKWRQAGLTEPVPITLTALDVGNMLEAFKISRRYAGSHNLDDYVDGAGYAGCAGEIAEKMLRNG